MKVMERAWAEEDIRSILVLEDDVALVPKFRQHLKSALEALPTDWELFFLGASGCVRVDGDDGDVAPILSAKSIVMRAKNCWTTHAYAVNGAKTIKKIFDAQRDRLLPADSLLVELQKEMVSYAARPALAYQRVGPSDIALFNRGHLGLRVPLTSSDADAALLPLWAAASTGVPLRFPLAAFNGLALQMLSFAKHGGNAAERSIFEFASTYALPLSQREKGICRWESCEVNVSAMHRVGGGFYWKRAFEASVRWSPRPWSKEENVYTFETEETYYTHRQDRGWPLDWSMVATVLDSSGMWGGNAAAHSAGDARSSGDDETNVAALQTFLAISLLAGKPSLSNTASPSCPDGSVPLRFLRRLRTASGTTAMIDAVPTLVRLRLVGYVHPRGACNDDGIGIVVAPTRNASRMVRTAVAQLPKSARRRLRRWHLMAVASNVPSPTSFVPNTDGTTRQHVRWSSVRRELSRLFDASITATNGVEDPKNVAIAGALLLRVHALALTDERFSAASRLARRANALASLLPASSLIGRTLRVRALRHASLSFQMSVDARDREEGAEVLARLLEAAEDIDRLKLSDADSAGLAAEAGLLLHARGIHAQATRQFVASASYAERVVKDASWQCVGALVSSNVLTTSPFVRYWRYLDVSDRARAQSRCQQIAESRNASIFLVSFGTTADAPSSCAIVASEDVTTFALESDLEFVVDEEDEASPKVAALRVFKRVTSLERVDTRLALAEIQAAVGAVRLWQGRLDVAGSLLVESTRAIQDALQDRTDALSRAEECHPLFGRAYANYVLWNGLTTPSGVSTSVRTVSDLKVCVDILRCAFTSTANWREAQIHADLSQLHALDGDRDRSIAHAQASLDLYDSLLADTGDRDHPLRVRAQLLDSAVRKIFDKPRNDESHRDVSSASSADVTIDVKIDDSFRRFRVRAGENVSALAVAFTEAHGLDASNADFLCRRIYQRRAAFLSAYGGPSAKYET